MTTRSRKYFKNVNSGAITLIDKYVGTVKARCTYNKETNTMRVFLPKSIKSGNYNCPDLQKMISLPK